VTIPATTPADGVTDEQLDAALDAFNVFPCPMNGSVVRFPHPDQMRAAIAAALATPSPGKAEAERFAFLIDRGLELIACECEVGPPRMWTLGGMSQPIGWFPTQRAAIDAAIQQERDKQ